MEKCLLVCLLAAAGVLGEIAWPINIDPQGNWKVVGGTDAEEGAHPHQVSIRNYGSHTCGGSIVDREWVITAAHCVVGASARAMSVVAGSNKLSYGGQTYKVRELHYHENYDAWRIQNDIAILKVQPIGFTDTVKPIAVETQHVGGEEACTLSGWGTTSYPGSIPDKLQHINLTTISVEECNRIHGSNVIESQVCTLTQKGQGACHGDSGGPLTRRVDGVATLIGVVSWGRPCAAGYPDVFTRASSFLDWCNKQCDNCVNN